MMRTYKKYKIVIVAALLLLIYSFNPHLAMLCFCVLFQALLIIEIVKEIKAFQKVRNGVFVDASLTSFRKIKGYEDDVHNYEGELEFFWPNESSKYQIQHKFSSLSAPNLFKKFVIAVNTNNPVKSTVVSRFNINWKLSVFFFLIVFIGLFFIDFKLFVRLNIF